MLPELVNPRRVASAAIRGYLFQTLGIAHRWLALPEGELLLCEGNEDLDQLILGADGSVLSATQVQFKDIQGSLSARDDQVQQSIFNFLKAYRRYDEQQVKAHFVFTTSASRARQQVNAGTGRANSLPLDIDVLKRWIELDETAQRLDAQDDLIAALRAIVVAARPDEEDAGKLARLLREHEELTDAVSYLDAHADRWQSFLKSVAWEFGAGANPEQLHELEQALLADLRTRALPCQLLAQRLIGAVLDKSTKAGAGMRTLARGDLDLIVRISESELREWAGRASASALSLFVAELSNRVDTLALQSAEHGARLDTHDEHLRHLDGRSRDRLLRRSKSTLAELKKSSQLQLGSTGLCIPRVVAKEIASAALEGSFVVVGDPGAGKSGVLAVAAADIEERGHDTIVLKADAAYEVGDKLVDLLHEWGGNKPAVLFVDSLDSLRDDTKAARVRDLLDGVMGLRGRWRVVASIRTFDLYQGARTAAQFEGQPPTSFSDPRFSKVRHVSVGDLTDDELKHLEGTAPALSSLIMTAPLALSRLFRSPFNLFLGATLIGAGVPASDLSTVRDRVQLLELYWRERIAKHAPDKDSREALLRAVCDRMIEQRSLQVAKSAVDQSRLYDLLTANVLREPHIGLEEHDDAYVAFSHDVLFDYAVSKLWLPSDPAALVEKIATDPQLLIMLRPSLDYALHRLWSKDGSRQLFWQLVIDMCGDARVREVGKILGPSIAAREATDWNEFQPLVRRLSTGERCSGAETALQYVVGALIPKPADGRPVGGEDSGPWARLAEFAASDPHTTFGAACARRLLFALLQDSSQLTTEQLSSSGRAARRLLQLATSKPEHVDMLSPALGFTCRTFASDPTASAVCLRDLLEPASLKSLGHISLRAIAREVSCLQEDPKLLSTLYVAAFTTDEDSTARTNFGGVVFGVSSNRRQDYEGGLYLLERAFPTFLRAYPKVATHALVKIMAAYVVYRHPPHSGQVLVSELQILGKDVSMQTDYSSIWERGGRDHAVTMARAWESYVAELASSQANQLLVSELFDTCVKHNRLAFFWRRWLKLAANPVSSSVVGPIVVGLLENAPLLVAYDTHALACEALSAIFSGLSRGDRERVERSVMASVTSPEQDPYSNRPHLRLLGCLTAADVTTDDARAAIHDMQVRGTSVPAVPSIGDVRVTMGGSRSREDWLADSGVPLGEEAHRRIHEASLLVERMSSAIAADPSEGACRALLEKAEDLAMSLSAEPVHPSLAGEGWSQITIATAAAARALKVSDGAALKDRVVALAIAVASCPYPAQAANDGTFDEQVGWSTPHPRGDIVEVLIHLAITAPNQETFALLSQLAQDKVPSVRYQIVDQLGGLYQCAPEFVRETTQRVVEDEPSRGVLQGLVARTIPYVVGDEPSLAAGWLGQLLQRIQLGPGAERVRELTVELLASLHLQNGNEIARSILDECLRIPGSTENQIVAQCIRHELAAGPSDASDEQADRRRQRAREMFASIVEHAALALAELHREGEKPLGDEERELLSNLVRCIDTCAKQLYFASGAHDAKEPSSKVPNTLQIGLS